MKHLKVSTIIHSFILAIALLVVFPVAAAAAESIDSLDVIIVVKEDGSLFVKESIAYDFDTEVKRGIYRTIPSRHAQEASSFYKNRYIEVDNVVATRNGIADRVQISEVAGETKIRIGKPSVYLKEKQTYVLSYNVNGALAYYEAENPELYWDAIGSQWSVPIANVSVAVYDPDEVFLGQQTCYRGFFGSTEYCGNDVAPSGKSLYVAENLAPGEMVTIAQELNPDKVAVVILESVYIFYYIFIFFVILIIGAGVWVYRFKTFHKPNAPLVVQYEPYSDVLPMYTGVLKDGRLDPHDITAGLLYLAQEGFISINKTSEKVMYFFEVDDYEVTLKRPKSETASHFHTVLLDLLFITDIPGGFAVKLSELKETVHRQRANAGYIKNLKESIKEDLLERGFYESTYKRGSLTALSALAFVLLIFVGFPGVVFLASIGGITFPGFVFPVMVGCAVVLGIIVAVVARRRTKLGYEALYHISGFEKFLSATDKERFDFHNAPEKNPQQFMEYLPYAVALGIEEKWAEVFEDVTIQNPDWYTSDTSVSSFSATELTGNLGAFSTSFVSSTGTSGGSSGSSGGGFSGGGSGGGGGGSW